MTNWIDFKQLRSKLNFEAVLRHFNVEVKKKGTQHHGFCPLPEHNGKRNSPSFSANLNAAYSSASDVAPKATSWSSRP